MRTLPIFLSDCTEPDDTHDDEVGIHFIHSQSLQCDTPCPFQYAEEFFIPELGFDLVEEKEDRSEHIVLGFRTYFRGHYGAGSIEPMDTDDLLGYLEYCLPW